MKIMRAAGNVMNIHNSIAFETTKGLFRSVANPQAIAALLVGLLLLLLWQVPEAKAAQTGGFV